MDLIIDRAKTVCFSGHRPQKLPDKGNPDSQAILVLKSLLRQEITDAVNEGFNTFISGMAAGIDMWAAETIEEFMERNNNLKLYCVYPYRSYDKKYKSAEERQHSERIISQATSVIYVNEEYSQTCMYERNRFMIDHSSRLVAVIGDYKTGTGYTVRYAKKTGIDIHIIDLKKLFPVMENLTIF